MESNCQRLTCKLGRSIRTQCNPQCRRRLVRANAIKQAQATAIVAEVNDGLQKAVNENVLLTQEIEKLRQELAELRRGSGEPIESKESETEHRKPGRPRSVR